MIKAGSLVTLLCVAFSLTGCAVYDKVMHRNELMPAEAKGRSQWNYLIGPGDSISIFVWRNPDLSGNATVRPDGRISVPLVEDLPASGRTPTQLARDIEKKLAEYVRDPLVTVSVGGFNGEFEQQIRVVGEAAKPQSLPYREKMTVLDVMIAVGGLTNFADGNDASIVRKTAEGEVQRRVRLEDLVRDGDISANVEMLPGDILIIPEAWF